MDLYSKPVLQFVLPVAVRGEDGADESADRGTAAAVETQVGDPTRANRRGRWNGTRHPEQVPELPAAVGRNVVRRREEKPANTTKVF